MPTVNFTAPADLAIDAEVQIGLSGGMPKGGVYSGPGVTDDGNGRTYSFDPIAAGVGTHTLVYTYGNDNNCVNSVQDHIRVSAPIDPCSNDNIPPVAVCQDITIELDATGNAVVTPYQINNGSYDNCSGVNLSLSNTAYNASHIGNNEVTLTVNDAKGNRSSCTATVKVLPFKEDCDVVIVEQPKDVALCVGDPLYISIEASGTENLTYRWEYSKNGEPWCSVDFSSEESPEIKLPCVTPHYNGKLYRVTVISDNGTPNDISDDCSVQSDTAVVRVYDKPVVSFDDPGSFFVNAGTQKDLGGGYPSGGYYSGPGVTDKGNGTFEFKPSMAGIGQHKLSYTYGNDNGCKATAKVCIEVFPECDIEIQEQPQDLFVCPYATDQHMKVEATASGKISYEWQYSKDGGVSWYRYSGSGDDTHILHFPSLTEHYNDKMLRVLLTSENSQLYSGIATIHWINPPKVLFETFDEIGVNAGVQQNLSGGYPEGGRYKGPGVTDNGDGSFDFDPKTAGAGTHEISYSVTTENGCISRASKLVYVSSPCQISITEQPQHMTVCSDYEGSINFNAQAECEGSLAYQWQYYDHDQDKWKDVDDATSNSFTTTIEEIGEFRDFRVKVSSDNTTPDYGSDDCTVASQVAKVCIQERPKVAISGQKEFCEGYATELTASGGDTYSWSGPDGFEATSSIIQIDVPGTYSVTTYSTESCASHTCTIEVVEKQKPNVSLTALGQIGSDAGMQTGLSGGYPEGGVYSGVGVTDNGDGTTYIFDPTEAGVGTHTITYSYTDDNGCANSATDEVVVFNGCQITILEHPGHVEVCANDQTGGFHINALGNGMLSYQWEVSNNGGTTWSMVGNAESTYEVGIATEELSGLMVRVVVTSDNKTPNNPIDDCSMTSHAAILTVNSFPDAMISGELEICEGTTTVLTASGGSLYQWTGPNDFTASSASIEVGEAGIYQVTVSNASGCSVSKIVLVSVNALPHISFDSLPNLTLDAGVQSSLGGASPKGGLYSGLGVTDNGDGETFSFNPIVAGTGLHTITYTYKDEYGCSSTAMATINVETAHSVMINELQPNPTGVDPSTAVVELKGKAGEYFSGWLISLDGDPENSGELNESFEVNGIFDSNGLLTVEIDDLENPSFTLVLSSQFTVGVTDFDSNDDGTLDADIGLLGFIYDALGIPDTKGDEVYVFGKALGGNDFNYTGDEPQLVFRDGATNVWYAINDPSGTIAFDLQSNTFSFALFDKDPSVHTFGDVNPVLNAESNLARTPSRLMVWPNHAVENVNIRIYGPMQVKVYELYDMSGRLIERFNGHSGHAITIDVLGYPNGVYVLKAIGNKGERKMTRISVNR